MVHEMMVVDMTTKTMILGAQYFSLFLKTIRTVPYRSGNPV